jgi:hypothetical protein
MSAELHTHTRRITNGSTVGAQSIARAQSIAHGHIGNHIFEKNEIFKKLFLQKIKRVNSAADS